MTPTPPQLPAADGLWAGRVQDYMRYRPGYPIAVLATLRDHCDLTEQSVIADVGAGTGLLAELFLGNGNHVFAVEPDEEMIEACLMLTKRYPALTLVRGMAGATTLPEASVDFVTAGRSFHWFNLSRAHAEFKRILRNDGWVAIVTNGTRHSTAPVAKEFRDVHRRWRLDGTDGERHYEFGYKLPGFLDERTMGAEQMQEVITLTKDGLTGYALSMSSTPRRDHPNFPPMQRELDALFEKHAADGQFRMPLMTEVIYGRLRGKYNEQP